MLNFFCRIAEAHVFKTYEAIFGKVMGKFMIIFRVEHCMSEKTRRAKILQSVIFFDERFYIQLSIYSKRLDHCNAKYLNLRKFETFEECKTSIFRNYLKTVLP